MRRMSPVVSLSLVIVLTSLLTFVLPGAPALAAEWSQAAEGGIGGDFKPADETASSFAVYNDQFYVGTSNTGEGCGVWRLEGTDWVRLNAPGFGDRDISDVNCMAVFKGKLYGGTGNMGGEGCEVWSYDSSDWARVVGPGASIGRGFGNDNNRAAFSMAAYGGMLYVGTGNYYDGCEV